MRTIQLTHEEIELITKALDFTYNHTLNQASSVVLSANVIMQMIGIANKYCDLSVEISNGEKDV